MTRPTNAVATASGASTQSFEGSTLDFQYYFPTSGSPYSGADNGSFVVGPGVEVTDIASVATLDVSGTNILVDFTLDSSWTSAAFNGWVLSDQTDSLAAILGVTINPATNLGGFSLSNVSWTGDSITVNWQGLTFDANTIVSLDVAFNEDTPVVPEPATWARC